MYIHHIYPFSHPTSLHFKFQPLIISHTFLTSFTSTLLNFSFMTNHQTTFQLTTTMILQSSCSLSSHQSNVSKSISDHPILTLLEKNCTSMKDLKKIHAHIIKTGLHRDTIALSRVLTFTATHPSGDIHYALSVFDRIQNQNLYTWNTIIRGFSRSSSPQIAILLFIEMLVESSIEPNRLTYPLLFKVFAQMGRARCGAQLHGRVKKLGLDKYPFVRNTIIYMYANCGFLNEAGKIFDEDDQELDVVAWNSMMLGFAKCGRVDECRRLFDKMGKRRTIISWNTMISGYVRKGGIEEVFELFGQMQEEGIKPSEYTMVSLLNACAHLGALEQGEWLYYYLHTNYDDFNLNPIVVTAIVNMYCKCGEIRKAHKVFDTSPKKGLSCWNSMILGLANNGYVDKAIQLFKQLELSEFKPDGVTFLGVLTACVYSGNVNQARDYFLMMTQKYEIEPSIKHYSCMVEVLGKVGLFNEAVELINSMPMSPDVATWGSLLSASRKHGNVEMASLASKHVKELDSKDSSAYVMMSNVLAASGEYENAVEQRVLMKKKDVLKERGGSSIDIDGEVREFAAGGRLQPQAEEVSMLLLLHDSIK